MNKTAFLLVLCFFLAAGIAVSMDFGLVISQEAAVEEDVFQYTPAAGPWFSGRLGEKLRFHLSGKAALKYTDTDGWRDDPLFLLEAGRSELTWFASPSLYVRLGRQEFRDPSGLAASGLFDGASASFSAGGGRFLAGAYYTGLLYKDTADIIMSGRDKEDHDESFSNGGGYFASRRIVAALQWENPAAGPRSSFSLGLLGQLDCNGGEDEYNSQYLSGRYGVRLSNTGLEAAAALGAGEDPDGNLSLFFTGSLGLDRRFSVAQDARLGIRGIYSSPDTGGRVSPFLPINSLPQGQVFSPALGGISVIKGFCTLRPLRTLALGAECSWFIRMDTVSFEDNVEPGKLKSSGYFLGGEAYGTVNWTPAPDMAFSIGGGAFFPALGNAFESDAKIRWKASAGIILSL